MDWKLILTQVGIQLLGSVLEQSKVKPQVTPITDKPNDPSSTIKPKKRSVKKKT